MENWSGATSNFQENNQRTNKNKEKNQVAYPCTVATSLCFAWKVKKKSIYDLKYIHKCWQAITKLLVNS